MKLFSLLLIIFSTAITHSSMAMTCHGIQGSVGKEGVITAQGPATIVLSFTDTDKIVPPQYKDHVCVANLSYSKGEYRGYNVNKDLSNPNCKAASGLTVRVLDAKRAIVDMSWPYSAGDDHWSIVTSFLCWK